MFACPAALRTRHEDTGAWPGHGSQSVAACAHVLSHGPPCRWKEGELREWSAISYPDTLHAYAEAEFEKMKQMQADLLGISTGPRAKL